METYKRHNVHPVMPDLHTEACLQNSCGESQQEQLSSKPELQHLFLDATSTSENIPAANDVLIPLAVEFNASLCTYKEPAHDEKSAIVIKSTTVCTTNTSFEEP